MTPLMFGVVVVVALALTAVWAFSSVIWPVPLTGRDVNANIIPIDHTAHGRSPYCPRCRDVN